MEKLGEKENVQLFNNSIQFSFLSSSDVWGGAKMYGMGEGGREEAKKVQLSESKYSIFGVSGTAALLSKYDNAGLEDARFGGRVAAHFEKM